MNEIAKAIYLQLGGNRFSVMTGAKNFVQDTNSLCFKIGKGAKKSINLVKVTLLPSDTYKMEFYSSRGIDCKLRSEFEDVYCDQLQEIFTQETGFFTHL